MNKFSFAGMEPANGLYRTVTGKGIGVHGVELSLNNQGQECESAPANDSG